MTGFEPATSWSQTRRSTKLSYTPSNEGVLTTVQRAAHVDSQSNINCIGVPRLSAHRHFARLTTVRAQKKVLPDSSSDCILPRPRRDSLLSPASALSVRHVQTR